MVLQSLNYYFSIYKDGLLAVREGILFTCRHRELHQLKNKLTIVWIKAHIGLMNNEKQMRYFQEV